MKGFGNQQDYGMRIYDTRLGRFLSVDPLTKKYPQLTPYQFSSNRPIDGIDLDGLEYAPANLNGRDATVVETGRNPASVRPLVGKKPAIKTIDPQPFNPQTLRPGPGQYSFERENSERLKVKHEFDQYAINRINLDPFAAGVAFNIMNPGQAIVSNTISHGIGIYEGIEEGNPWKVAGNTVMLALDVAPFFIKGGGAVPTRTQSSGLLTLGSDAAILENAANRVAKRGWYDVIVHGTSDGLGFIVDGKQLTPSDLFNQMVKNGYQTGTNIRLISCYSGKLESGAASQLSKLSNSMVVAPSGPTFIGSGAVYQAGKPYVVGGSYNVFK